MDDVTPLVTAGLAAVGLVAGFVDAIAGRRRPSLGAGAAAGGLDPVSALATNKLQSSFGSGSAVYAFARRRLIDFRGSRGLVGATFAGACLGVAAIRIAPLALLSAILPVLLVAMAIYFAVSPTLSDSDARARMTRGGFTGVAAVIGFYDGVFGPGHRFLPHARLRAAARLRRRQGGRPYQTAQFYLQHRGPAPCSGSRAISCGLSALPWAPARFSVPRRARTSPSGMARGWCGRSWWSSAAPWRSG